jgi:hypothetical protein
MPSTEFGGELQWGKFPLRVRVCHVYEIAARVYVYIAWVEGAAAGMPPALAASPACSGRTPVTAVASGSALRASSRDSRAAFLSSYNCWRLHLFREAHVGHHL